MTFSSPEDLYHRLAEKTGRLIQGRRYLLVTLILAGLIYLPGQGHGLYRTSDARVCAMAREMLETGQYAAPRFNGRVFLEKPPLVLVLMALSMKLFGVSEAAARVPTAILAVLGLMGTAVIGRRLKDERLAVAMALIVGTSTLYLKRGHEACIDVALATTVTWSLAAFLHAYRPFTREQNNFYLVLFYGFMTAAFYVKGLVGPLVPILTVAVYVLWLRDYGAVWRLKPWLGLLIFALLALPWHYQLFREGGWDYLSIFYLDNHLYRFIQSDQVDLGHHTEWSWYLVSTWKFFRPWSLLFPVALLAPFRKEFRAWFGPDSSKFALSWLVPSFLFFSVSLTKREDYLLPIYGAWAALMGAWMLFRLDTGRGPRWEKYYALIFAWVMAGAVVYVVAVSARGYSGSWLFFIPVSFLALAGAGLIVWRTVQGPPFQTLAAVLAASMLAALPGTYFLLPIEDRNRDHSQFSQQTAELTDREPLLFALEPSETERGFLGFYCRRPVTDLGMNPIKLEEIPAQVQRIPVAMIYRTDEQVQDKIAALEKAGMRVQEALREKVGDRKYCVLLWAYPGQGNKGNP